MSGWIFVNYRQRDVDGMLLPHVLLVDPGWLADLHARTDGQPAYCPWCWTADTCPSISISRRAYAPWPTPKR